ncbi:MAG: hypothetical protein EHM80_08065 [Nitrospiraceae bacterium]|nr:MAG: hypothetical protein EHM80_08065 [Nitrospiraceae bacterium]
MSIDYKRVTREGLTYFRASLSGYDSVSLLQILLQAGTHASLTRFCSLSNCGLYRIEMRPGSLVCGDNLKNRAEIVMK